MQGQPALVGALTLPKTTCLPLSQGVSAVVMKNCAAVAGLPSLSRWQASAFAMLARRSCQLFSSKVTAIFAHQAAAGRTWTPSCCLYKASATPHPLAMCEHAYCYQTHLAPAKGVRPRVRISCRRLESARAQHKHCCVKCKWHDTISSNCLS